MKWIKLLDKRYINLEHISSLELEARIIVINNASLQLDEESFDYVRKLIEAEMPKPKKTGKTKGT